MITISKSRWAMVGALLVGIGPLARAASSPQSDQYPADVAVAWMDFLVGAVKTEKYSPPVASRLYAYAAVTLYESVAPGIRGHRSLSHQLNELGQIPKPRSALKYHWPTVTNAALASVLRSLLASASAGTLAGIDNLESQFNALYQPELRLRVFNRSVAHGQAIAAVVFDWSLGDGFSTFNNCQYTPPVGPGLWEPTPPDFKPALQPCWGELRTFALPTADFCQPPPPPQYSTDPGSEFYVEGQEVYDVSQNLTQEQKDIATFWADSPGVTGTPPGHWIRIVGTVCDQYDLKLDVAAEAYARVGIAVADAFIACWNAKYNFNLLRPVTYIRNVFQADWLPYLNTTPAFPEFTSGHSTQSGAVAELLTDFLGELPFTDDTHADLGYPSRHFDTFFDAAHEAAISRLYAGIHYRAACELGVDQGRCVGMIIGSVIDFEKHSDDD